MRFPSQRLSRLFDLLQNETLPQDELARRLNVTTRTVRADISALNELLRQHGVQLVLNRGSGYQLTVDDMGRYQALQASRPKALRIPRTAPERVHYLAVRFLTSAFSLKLEDLAEEWFVSRATLQNDMAEVRELFTRYNLTLETRPRHGMKLFGSEMALRACLTDLLWQLAQQDSANPLITEEALNAGVQERLAERLPTIFAHARLRFTDEGEQFIRLYCAVAVRRISEGFPLPEFVADDVDDNVREARAASRRCCKRCAVNRCQRRKRTGCGCISPRARCRSWSRAPSAPMTPKRWRATSCAISTRTITTIC